MTQKNKELPDTVKNQWLNPIGLDGMEFVEYCSSQPEDLEKLFKTFGFQKTASHKTKPVDLYQQGGVNFIVNRANSGFAHNFSKAHGPSICATGFRVKNAKEAMQEAIRRGARAYEGEGHNFPAIYGIGDSLVYFVDQYQQGTTYSDFDFSIATPPEGFGFRLIDHLTNNVPRGEMQKWCDFYENIFNFKETRYFEIDGKETGLVSKVMMSPCKRIIIPINEPSKGKSQIQEYLDEYHGSGIQHLALLTKDILKTVDGMARANIGFLDTPDTYYETVKKRVPNLTEDLDDLKKLRVLADGDEEGYILQIFTKNIVGPIFFEIIQRKKHEGFGEGNFQALFDSIEEDQRRRGYLS